jgi:hypothetical protein
LTTITFLGELQDITDPEAAVPAAGRTTNAQGCPVRQRTVDDQPGLAEQVSWAGDVNPTEGADDPAQILRAAK